MQRLLLETFEGLNLTDRQRKIFDDVNVENVVVSKENKLIEIYLVSSHVVAYREICLLEYALGVFFGNADIDIKVHDRFELSQQYNAKVFFDEYKDSLLQISKLKISALFFIFSTVDALGRGRIPRCNSQRRQIWAIDLLYFAAISLSSSLEKALPCISGPHASTRISCSLQ